MRTRLRVVPFRRKREGKTNYRKRLRMLVTQKPRLVVRPALKNITAQLVVYGPQGDRVVVGTNSCALDKYGWSVHKGNLPAAYLTGYLLGKLAMKNDIHEAILDTGLQTPIKGSRIYACVKGIVDAGVAVPVAREVLPSDERASGAHISLYSQKNKEQFHDYTKKGVDPIKIVLLFSRVKAAIEEKI